METVTDNSSEKRYFTQMCNLIDELDLSPLAIALYFHYKRWAFADKKHPNGVKFLSEKYKVGHRAIRAAKDELVKNKLVKFKTFDTKLAKPDEAIIIDIWERNHKHFQQDSISPVVNQPQVSNPMVNQPQPYVQITTALCPDNHAIEEIEDIEDVREKEEIDARDTSKNPQSKVNIQTVHYQGKSDSPAPLDAIHPKLHNFPFLERSRLMPEVMREIAELFSYFAEQQKRSTLINEKEWLDLCEQLEKEGMSFFGIKCLYRYCSEVAKLKTVTPKVMNWKLADYKQFVEKQKRSEAARKQTIEPFNPNQIKLEKTNLPAGY